MLQMMPEDVKNDEEKYEQFVRNQYDEFLHNQGQSGSSSATPRSRGVLKKLCVAPSLALYPFARMLTTARCALAVGASR